MLRKAIWEHPVWVGGAALMLKSLGAGLSFAFNFYVARLLGASGSASIYLAIAYSAGLAILARGGLDNSIIKYVSIASGNGDGAEVTRIVGTSLGVVVPLSALLSAFAILALRTTGLAIVGPIVLAAIPLAIATIAANALQGLGKTSLSQFILYVLQPGATILFIAIQDHPDAVTVSLAYGGGAAICAIVALLCIRNLVLAHRGELRQDFSLATPLLATAKSLFVVSSLELITTTLPIILLGHFSTPSDTAYFNIGWKCSLLINFFLLATAGLTSSRIAPLFHDANTDALKVAIRGASTMSIIWAILLGAAVIILAPKILFVFGPQFVAGTLILRLLALQQIIGALGGPMNYVLMMVGEERYLRRVTIPLAVINVLTLAICVYLWGGVGAAAALLGYTTLQRFILALRIRKTLGFWPTGVSLNS